MATKSCQAQVPAMSAAAERASATSAAAGGGGARVPTGSMQPPRRGQIKEKIIKDVVAAVFNIAAAAGLVRADNNAAGAGGQPAVADNNADEK